ncbi:ankyrin repeat-containing domain protein, partial [Baffinella frigidus]
DAIKMLVMDHGVEVDSLNGTGNTALISSARRGRMLSVAALLRSGAEVDRRDPKGLTALHHAARGLFSSEGGKYCKTMQLLIDAGADINALCMRNYTALHESCENGQVTQSILLLRCGARFDLRDIQGHTPLHLAAVKNSNDTLVSILLSCGASPYTVNYVNGSPMHDAFQLFPVVGVLSAMQILLDYGASMQIRNNAGMTARDSAV